MGFFDNITKLFTPPGSDIPPEVLQQLMRQQMLMGGMQLLGGIGQQDPSNPYGQLFSSLSQGAQNFQSGALDYQNRIRDTQRFESQQKYYDLTQEKLIKEGQYEDEDRATKKASDIDILETTKNYLRSQGVPEEVISTIDTAEAAKNYLNAFFKEKDDIRMGETAARSKANIEDQIRHRKVLEENEAKRIAIAAANAAAKSKKGTFDSIPLGQRVNAIRRQIQAWDDSTTNYLLPENLQPPQEYLEATDPEERIRIATEYYRTIANTMGAGFQTNISPPPIVEPSVSSPSMIQPSPVVQPSPVKPTVSPIPPLVASLGVTQEDWNSYTEEQRSNILRIVMGQ